MTVLKLECIASRCMSLLSAQRFELYPPRDSLFKSSCGSVCMLRHARLDYVGSKIDVLVKFVRV